MKIATVIGTRPEAIKMAPVIRALRARDDIETMVISTGQHREMLKQALDWFEIVPDDELQLMQDRQTLNGLLSRALTALDERFTATPPDVVVAQGDTTTVLAAALASFHRQIPFAHVEAGLRTYNLDAPFPEEANRALVGRITRHHFAPTERAAQALREERVPGDVHVVGNTVVDALQWTAERVDHPSAPRQDRYVLITGHRRENIGERFDRLFAGLKQLAERHPDTDLIYPVHLNPAIGEAARKHLDGVANVQLIEPVSYPEMVALMKFAALIITDSGGIQEEAPSFSVPTLVMRDTTERPEAVEAGVCELIGADPSRMVDRATAILSKGSGKSGDGKNPFGDGRSAERIVEILRGQYA